MWRKNISINNRQKKEKELYYEKKKYPMVSENKLEIKKNNNKNFNDRKAHDSYSFRKCDSLGFEGLLNEFRNYLINKTLNKSNHYNNLRINQIFRFKDEKN